MGFIIRAMLAVACATLGKIMPTPVSVLSGVRAVGGSVG